ncbi:hypothetical protein B296_00003995 [Ensete ventricosum]|uniref:Uncharacterized protein n=1 Tax=Ensete ventricosum TaxID=4639 RepID=A0A426YZA3_ENSVE|nr:hypothetical protein B296_00003995 [Ensete ventricosum]
MNKRQESLNTAEKNSPRGGKVENGLYADRRFSNHGEGENTCIRCFNECAPLLSSMPILFLLWHFAPIIIPLRNPLFRLDFNSSKYPFGIHPRRIHKHLNELLSLLGLVVNTYSDLGCCLETTSLAFPFAADHFTSHSRVDNTRRNYTGIKNVARVRNYAHYTLNAKVSIIISKKR